MPNYLKLLILTAFVLISTSDSVVSQDVLIFSATTNPPPAAMATTTQRSTGDFVLVNNMPVLGTVAPFVAAPQAPSPQFLDCFGRCPTTSEYNPICASDRQLYRNEQKFYCARFCGANIQIVRRGSCEGLFPMQRG